jgi:hypothetical protein
VLITANLISIRDAPVVFPPRRLLHVSDQMRASNVMVDANFGAAQAGEVFLNLVRAGAFQRIGFLIGVDNQNEPAAEIAGRASSPVVAALGLRIFSKTR